MPTEEDEPTVAQDDTVEEQSTPPKRTRPWWLRTLQWVGELLIYLVIALIVVSLIRVFLLQNYVVPSGSMENTLQVDDMILAWKPVQPHRGDIVVFRDDMDWLPPMGTTDASPLKRLLAWGRLLPPLDEQYLVKRVIGLEGDMVECCDPQGRIMVNGYAVDEPYLLYNRADVALKPFHAVVPEGRMFVMGDHRDGSKDSRFILCAEEQSRAMPKVASVQGRVFSILRPIAHFRTFSSSEAYAGVPPPSGSPPSLASAPWECP
ncbi:MAG: signal peptidase I [Propionibacteriaceae bacterium]|jgi:signal peptidase I|nr:signal peptidase I [Propionibacteriaceae bacterium]